MPSDEVAKLHKSEDIRELSLHLSPGRGDITGTYKPGELLHERDLIRRIALVRMVLTFANVGVIWLDRTIPSEGTATAYTWAFAAAGIFIAYATILYALLRRSKPLSHRIAVASPLLDVMFAAVLIVATDGYLSPFNLWLVFAVVSAGFSRYRLLPFATAVLAVGAHILIAMIPQVRPLDVTVFAVRTGYLFGVAAVLSMICSYLTTQSIALSMIDEVGKQFAMAITEEAIVKLLIDRVIQSVGSRHVKVILAEGRKTELGRRDFPCFPLTVELQVSGQTLGTLTGHKPKAWTWMDTMVTRMLCDRASSALLRARISNELTRTAAANERLRMTDELHDTSIQTLAALDLRLEAARVMAEECDPELARDLASIKAIARMASTQFRDALVAREDNGIVGPEAIYELVRERWPVGSEVAIAPDVELSAQQWQAVEAFARAGLSNARKHGAASIVRLELSKRPDHKTICMLEDDGAVLETPVRFGYGLRRLAEFTRELGGAITLEPRVPHGARLILEFPGVA